MAEKTIKTVLIIVITVLLVSASLFAMHFLWNPTFISENVENSAVKIAGSYFDKQITLDDYKILKVAEKKTEDKGNNCIFVWYSVKPRAGYYNAWWGGTGDKSKDGWIVNKSGSIRYMKIGSVVITFLSLGVA